MPRLSVICLFAALALSLGGCDRQSAAKSQAEPVVANTATVRPSEALESANGMRAELSYRFAGRPASAATFQRADGREVDLGDFAGRPLLVNLWATWCAPCKIEMPTLDRLAVAEAGKVSVIAVSQDLKGRVLAQPYFIKAGITHLQPYTDPENRIWGAIGGTPTLPTTILYDSEGREVWRVMGGVEWDDDEIASLLAEAD